MPELKQNKRNAGFASIPNFPIALTRVFGWTIIGVLAAFLFNNFLTNWLGWPGVRLLANPSTGGHDPRIWLQVAIYAAAALAASAVAARPGLVVCAISLNSVEAPRVRWRQQPAR